MRILFLFSFLICIIPDIYSQGFRYLDMDDGLSSNQVFQVEKDSTGFMWFITYMGIDRFDGYQVKHYKLKDDSLVYENYPSYTRALLNNKGEFMVALQGGKIFRYNKFTDDFELYFDIRQRINYKDLMLLSVYLDSNDQLWIVSNFGLYVFNPQSEDFQSLFIFDNELPSCVQEDGKGSFYVGTDKHLYKLAKEITGGYVIVQQVDIGSQYGKVSRLLCKGQKIYIGTELKGVSVFDMSTNLVKSLFPVIPHAAIRSLNYAGYNKIVIGTDGSGVYIIDCDSDSLVSYFDSDHNSGNELTSNSVYDIAVDENNYIWITTYANGVNIIVPVLSGISYYKHIYNEPNSLANNQVNALLEDSDGNLWVGTNNGISCYHSETKKWKHYLMNNETRKAVVISLDEDGYKNIWAGTYGMGVFRINRQSGEVVNYKKEDQKLQASINTNYIYSIYTDKKDNVWFGGLWGKLTRYNIRENTFQYYSIETLGEIRPLSEKYLLIGTTAGFCLLDTGTSYFKEYSGFEGKNKKSAVRDFYVAGENEVWLGTEGSGLVLFNPRTESFQAYTTDQGLTSNYIYSIEDDKNGNIWITTERDIFKFNPQTGQFYGISSYLGLKNFSFTPCTSIRRQSGNLVFGTINGVLELPIDGITNTDIRAKLIFTDFKLFYNSVKIGEDNGILKNAINETNSLSLTYKQNSFSFAFSSINYSSPKQIIYSYMFENFDDKWYTATENNTVSYTNISPGNYQFRLKILNKDSRALIDERTIAVHISPPFWKSTYAYILYIVLFAFIIKLATQYMKGSIEKRYTKEKNQFFIDMAHDIRTPVSLIKAPLNDLSENENLTEKGQIALDIATRNTEKLALMITRLLDFQKADLSLLRLVVSKHELKEYIQERILLYKVEAEHKNITLILEMGFEQLHVWFDREKMDKIINNLLSNAVKYSRNDGQIIVNVSHDQKYWYLSVADNGIGIPQQEQKYLFKQFFRARNAINSRETGSGIGLMLTKKLVKLHEGSINFTSKENTGTEFKLSFQKGEEFFRKKEMLKVSVIEEESLHSDRDTEISGTNTGIEEYEKEKKKIRLLIVEDNDDMRLYLKNNLSAHYDIIEALGGQEALSIITETHPDFIISDNLMPNMNGDEMCARLKNSMETSHIPVILLTALAEKENILKGLSCGADDYITKPFDISILKAKIRNILQFRENLKKTLSSSGNPDQNPEYTNPLDKEFLEKTIRIVEEHLDDPSFSMNNLYLTMGMSRSTYYNKLKALTGEGPNTFTRNIRLSKARELLQIGQYNVFEVSIMTGFTDPKYFSTVFKERFGISPSKIIK
ncbi:hybrid sensor histidine kinase/response regulator transcription factor [Dysgonomonas termitidis]|uniref:histidine kinase n=1 Tax=Dysgonomonas termitidis TaxID=1516126 RepID=A0ABV9L1C7_9BACT